ncbi:YfhO family protein [Fructobacillus sp. M2-14]|uniref:YfhO family protein n=2 Tax=Fructobacillus broussonetiae TaxID=2713173 RepID=A0ABS5R180_9LACO|nr:YfhO family protein [Fructobacillus broussonetiae]
MLFYFVYRGMAPFGSSTILTVDLGQQYLDYFAQFKHTILQDPSAFLYSFSTGLGGNMVGEWSYYLMSPFNLLFLIATTKSLPAWILVVTVLKIASAGWTMGFFLKKMDWLSGYYLPIFAINYPLSAWFIANDLNLLWLDTAILLPLLIWSLHHLVRTGKVRPFLFLLLATILTNYYIAWMVGLFVILYLPFLLLDKQSITNVWKKSWKFISTGAIAVLLSAWLWLPTVSQLQQGKTTHAVHWTLGFENNPLDLLLKLIPGSFDFDQMQSGQANWLVAPIIFFFMWAFFSNKQIRIAQKMAAGLALAILVLATTWTPLVLLFHGGQYPIWYPARFSFLISFLLIVMAAKGFDENWMPSIPARAFFLIATLGITVYGSLQMSKVSYIDKAELLVFLFGYLLVFLTLLFVTEKTLRLPVLGFLTVLFLLLNAALTLNHIAYLSTGEYQKGAKIVSDVDPALKQNKSFYRVAQGLGRTYNDAYLGHFNAGSHFSSLLSAKSSTFYRNIGQISGDSKLSYNNGTTITDSLLSFKYYLAPSNSYDKQPHSIKKSTRPDHNTAQVVASGQNWQLKENKSALPIAYAASTDALKTPLTVRYPLANQERLLTHLAGKPDEIFLSQKPMAITYLDNMEKPERITGGLLHPVDKKKKASATLTFTPDSNDPYYLNLGGAFDLSGVKLVLNGKVLTQETGYNHTVALNLVKDAKGQEQTLSIIMNKGVKSRYLDDFALYSFNQEAVRKDLQRLQTHQMTVTKRNSRRIEGTVETTKDQSLLMTSIPAENGWQARIDGKKVATKTVADGLLAVPTTPGKHQVTLTYTPPYFDLGLVISGLTALLGLFGVMINKRRF